MTVRSDVHRRMDFLAHSSLNTREERQRWIMAWKNLYLELSLAIKVCKSLRYPDPFASKLFTDPASHYQSQADRLRMYAKQMMGIRKRLQAMPRA